MLGCVLRVLVRSQFLSICRLTQTISHLQVYLGLLVIVTAAVALMDRLMDGELFVHMFLFANIRNPKLASSQSTGHFSVYFYF